jgi:hypothetical protein
MESDTIRGRVVERPLSAAGEPAGMGTTLAWLGGRRDERRPRWLLAVTLPSLVVTGSAAVISTWEASGGPFCTVTRRLSGQQIPGANALVLVSCIVGFAALIVVRNRPRLLVLTLLLLALALVVGVVLVAADSGVSRTVQECDFMGTDTETDTSRFGWVYVPWLGAVVVFLAQAARLPARADDPAEPVGAPLDSAG